MPTIASSPASPDTLFGRVRLGYLLIESVRLDAWSTFVTEGLGCMRIVRSPRCSPAGSMRISAA